MKYLEEPQLSWLNSVLGSYEIGDRVLNGKLETYSCKKAGSDKRLAKSLELYYQQEIEASAEFLGSSPLGPIAAPATRKLLINLISTMNASFPDYDFSAARPGQFRKESDFRIALQRINHDLAELLDAEGNGFAEKMWEAIAEAIKLDECDVYSYIPDMDSDPFSDGNLWSFNYFFYNKMQKKVLYFTCLCKGLTYDSEVDDEVMDESTSTDEDGEDAMEDYFGMTSDWEDGS
ncbi:Mod5 protein sorting/negative effector of RNA Pol III synthesis [Plasmopara halstedii]|uniref:Repressor of RNA polymerase III transcription n=1 Tax=Plasmopara halstedii TaxID=4781 RepID=A0A0N7L3A5_PLAHL|nr:Mod5 protein sorting/negative effector of RNA Pol III synthesis [Plasmopara halstedii]CEG35331.1 Mod5 protein sorting/negative effector of RNA Pol III synthesis [Plasmopara halstedii]|eukprot:XP_024571700.1 Mod5 protein sorting/negative effector of RNA Pol III synthesis [Plasmopara halstedii]